MKRLAVTFVLSVVLAVTILVAAMWFGSPQVDWMYR